MALALLTLWQDMTFWLAGGLSRHCQDIVKTFVEVVRRGMQEGGNEVSVTCTAPLYQMMMMGHAGIIIFSLAGEWLRPLWRLSGGVCKRAAMRCL